jgi:hypothetical protein
LKLKGHKTGTPNPQVKLQRWECPIS